MRRILNPYHLDQQLTDFDAPGGADRTISAVLPEGSTWQRMAVLYERVAAEVAHLARQGTTSMVISGDCTTSIGTVAGLQRAGLDPAIAWFDAHGDVQTLETTSSGYIGGMPLRQLVGYRPELLAEPLGLRAVPEERVMLIDARDLDPPEAAYLAQAPIRRCTVAELAEVSLPEAPLYLHIDADVVDPDDLPGLLYPAPGGPRLAELIEALRDLASRAQVAAVGIGCTWRPGAGAGARFRDVLESLAPA